MAAIQQLGARHRFRSTRPRRPRRSPTRTSPGSHAASDTEYDWAWYGGLVGAYFRDHPGSVSPQLQVATVKVLGHDTAATRPLPRRWEREEEWYNFRTNPRPTVRVLAEVDERTHEPCGYSVPGGSG